MACRIENNPSVSAIYFALLQCGYDYYSFERDTVHNTAVESFIGTLKAPLFFSEVRQSSCEVYPFWPRAAILETASFFLNDSSDRFVDYDSLVKRMLATGDGHWHIRVGWGKRLLNTKALTVNLLVFDGLFTPSEKEFDTKAKLIMTLLGGPVFSLLLVAGLSALRFGGQPFQSDFFADGAIESFLNTALSVNLFILVLSVASIRYFHGEIKGLETDGLQIIHAIKRPDD